MADLDTMKIGYPQISGLTNKAFEDTINRIFLDRMEKMLKGEIVWNEDLTPDYEKNAKEIMEDGYVEVGFDYIILNKPVDGDSILSVSYYAYSSCRGGNSLCMRDMIVLNFDIKNEKLLSTSASDWGFTIDDKSVLNKTIRTYFNNNNEIRGAWEPEYGYM